MPDRFIPLSYPMDISQLVAILNKNFGELDSEGITKVYKGPSGRIAIIEGKLPYEGGYGSLYHDSTGTPRLIVGITPDGDVDIVKSKAGVSVLDVFS
ncbi:MAG TPA: hypothetical protein VJ836_00795 [Candidatus Saccharimonadales bacterium]|nr:hypothetical protein [Candidatus Saccharimonadales bacterium]